MAGSVKMEAPVKPALESGIVKKIVVAVLASIAATLIEYIDYIQATLYAILPPSVAWIVPLILTFISWAAGLAAVKERVEKPDIQEYYRRAKT